MRSRIVLTLSVLAVAVGVSACGSSSSSTSSTAAGSNAAASSAGGTVSGAQLQARVNAAKCMRGQGINVPDPGPNGVNDNLLRQLQQEYSQSQLNSALTACRSSIVQAFPQLANPAALAQRRQQALQFTKCMRSHGVDIPDPSIGPLGLPVLKGRSSIDVNSPQFKAAYSACASLLPNGKGG
jgi:hypothetical protein